jgi:hypothetical protein
LFSVAKLAEYASVVNVIARDLQIYTFGLIYFIPAFLMEESVELKLCISIPERVVLLGECVDSFTSPEDHVQMP